MPRAAVGLPWKQVAGCSIALNLCLIVLASFQRYIEFHHTHEHAPDLEDTRSERLRRAGGWAVRGGNLLTQSDVAASIDHLHNAPPGPQHYADRAELTSGGQPALRPPHEFKTWQDERRRHFLGRLVELQPRYAGPTGLQSLSRGAPVFATFTNAAPVYVEQLLNWAFHLRELGLPHVVVCLDPESEDIAASNGIPWVAVQNQTTSEDVRNDHATFRAMVSRKVDLARGMMETHGFREVIWTDTDVVWLRDPRPFLALHPTADVAIQTDCLSHVVEANYTAPFRHGFARCGHLPGNNFNNAFNTGMILLRDRPPTHAFLRAWLDYLLDANRMYVDLGGGNRAIVGDQLAFNTLMTQNALPWQIVDVEGDWRVVWAHNRTVKFMPLPTLLFAGGHSHFIQHTAAAFNTTPFYAHACLVPGHVPGKVARFKEHGLWALEEDAYYERGNYLAYENTVQTFIRLVEAGAGRSVPDLYKHMLAVSYQMEVILEASAMAAALNRTVVFPRFYCWCDFDWYAVVLDGCAMGGRPGRNGADLFAMPFECPIDVILNPHNLYHSGFPYRQERWLTHSRLPAAVRNSREGVLVVDARDEATRAYRQQMVRNTHTGALIATGTTDEGLREQLAPWAHVRILDLRNVVPGTFGGFTAPAAAQAVDRAVAPLFADRKWCCSGEQPMNASHLEWPYALPRPLAHSVQPPGTAVAPHTPRAVPRYVRPGFCDGIREDAKNMKFLEFENHPCTFLAMGLRVPDTVEQVFASAA